MAAAPRPRRRPGAVPVTVSAALAGLLALAALLLGRETPGGLRDGGPVQAATPPSVARPLWPGLATAPPPVPATATTPQAPPQPVPDLTVPGHDLTAVDVRALLAKDPALTADERRALDSCAGCEVRAPEFRDLTGDGRPELITAVVTTGPIVLHVYTLAGDRVLPILQVRVQSGFSAETVDSDLWLREPTSTTTRTSSHYRWDGTRLAPLEQRVDATGLLPPTGPAVEPANGTAVRPVRPTPTATPVPVPAPARTAAPSLPAVSPEAKR
ncbi:hypothetical protein ACPC54_13715 [Kitasatospora sp. NPDC094028]